MLPGGRASPLAATSNGSVPVDTARVPEDRASVVAVELDPDLRRSGNEDQPHGANSVVELLSAYLSGIASQHPREAQSSSRTGNSIYHGKT